MKKTGTKRKSTSSLLVLNAPETIRTSDLWFRGPIEISPAPSGCSYRSGSFLHFDLFQNRCRIRYRDAVGAKPVDVKLNRFLDQPFYLFDSLSDSHAAW
jgi:hypothetical protein